MNSATKVLVSVVIVLSLLALIGLFIAKEGSIFIFLIRLIGGLTIVAIFMSVILGGMPQMFSERCPKCKSLNSFSKVEEIIDKKTHIMYKRCRSCGYKKSDK